MLKRSMRPRIKSLIRGWVTPRSSAASACFNPRAVITFCRFAISSARILRYSASSGEKPRSRKTFPLDRVSFTFFTEHLSLPARSLVHKRAQPLPGEIEIGPADLLHALSYARHRLPIVRLQPTLHAPELEPCNLPDIVRETPDRLSGVPEPDHGLLAHDSTYKNLDTASMADRITTARSRRPSAAADTGVKRPRDRYTATMVTLKTDRLLLRPFRATDIDDYARMCADPEVISATDGPGRSRSETADASLGASAATIPKAGQASRSAGPLPDNIGAAATPSKGRAPRSTMPSPHWRRNTSSASSTRRTSDRFDSQSGSASGPRVLPKCSALPLRKRKERPLSTPQSATSARSEVRQVAPKLIELSEKVLYGDVWERPGLSKRDRSLITVAALTAMGWSDQLPGHLERALGNGVTREEIGELITHLAFYAGWPAAMTAGRIARKVFDERKP